MTNPEHDPFHGRVVVGMDGSDASARAARWAVQEARSRGRGITLAHSVLPVVTGGAFAVGIPPRLDLIEQMRVGAVTELTRMAADLDSPDVQVVVDIGTPSGLLLTASDSADLLVLGSRGRGGFADLLLGSVGTQVSSHASCPVVVLRDEARTDAQDVVVGIDGSPHSMAALEFAFNIASRRGWNVVAVHAWDVPSYDLIVSPDGPVPIPLENVADDEVRLAAEMLSGFSEEYPDVTVTESLIRSPAVQALLEASTNAALIVVGTRGRNAALGALLGSVSNGVLHKAHVPVAVVPLPEPELEAA